MIQMSKYLLNNSLFAKNDKLVDKNHIWEVGGTTRKGSLQSLGSWERIAGWGTCRACFKTRNLDRNASVINMVVRRRITGIPHCRARTAQ